jgi:hypothetical protein
MFALQMMSDWDLANRTCWMFLAAWTRARMVSLDSPNLSPLNFSGSTVFVGKTIFTTKDTKVTKEKCS